MTDRLHIEIISPTGYLFNGVAYMAVIPGVNGDMGVLAHHESVITMLKEGKILIYDDKQNIIEEFPVTGGFVEVLEDKLLALVD